METIRNATYSELNIWGNYLDGVLISKMLELPEPIINVSKDYSFRHGECVSFSPSQQNSESIWSYKTYEKSVPYIEESLDILLNVFTNKVQKIQNIKEIFDVTRIDVEVVIEDYDSFPPAISLQERHIKFINDIGAVFDVDIAIHLNVST